MLNTLRPDPIEQFSAWFEEARHHPGIADATAMCLATANADGRPSARIVLLKEHSPQGFVFYSNAESRKGEEIRMNPYAALCFYWEPLNRQVRVEGKLMEISRAEADAYFASRPRESQLGAWASEQSRPLTAREALMQRVAEFTKKFGAGAIPRPPYWQGWRLVPEAIEFWQAGAFRLHDRARYTRTGDGWMRQSLYP